MSAASTQVAAPALAFCTRASATRTSPEHIRTVGPEGLRFTGSAPDSTLCGRSLHRGADLARPVTSDGVDRLAGQRHAGGAPVLCPDCVTTYRTGPAS